MSDPITAALNAIKLLIELVLKLPSATGARRRENYEKLLVPLVDQMRQVHANHVIIMLAARNAVEELRLKVQARSYSGPWPLGETDMEELKRIVEVYRSARECHEDLRGVVRATAKELLTIVNFPEEQRLVLSVIHYFLGDGGTHPSDEKLNERIERILETSGDKYFESPSLYLYLTLGRMVGTVSKGMSPELNQISKIEHGPEIHKLLKLLDETRVELNDANMAIECHFVHLKAAITAKTLPRS